MINYFDKTNLKNFFSILFFLITMNLLNVNQVESAGTYLSSNSNNNNNAYSSNKNANQNSNGITLSISREDKLKKINDLSSPNKNLKEVISFLNKIDGFDPSRICSSLIRTDVQAKLSRLKSVISTCPGPGFCRLAMRQNGSIYGTSDSKLETIFNLTQVSDKLLLRDPSLLGANYIRFISAGKYLCIDSQNRLVASTINSKECLWYTNSKPITSASNRNVKLIIQKTQKVCKIITLVTKHVDFLSNNHNLDLCRNQIKIETTYPAELQRVKSNCIRINNPHATELSTLDSSLKFKSSNSLVTKPKLTTKQFISSTTTTKSTTTTTATTTTSTTSNLPLKFFTSNNKNSIFMRKLFTKPIDDDLFKTTKSKLKTNSNKYASLVNDLIKRLCTDYLKEELVYKKLASVEYHYIIRLNSQANELDDESDLAEIPKLCADYLMNSNKTDNFINELKNELKNLKHRDNDNNNNLVVLDKNSSEYNYYMNSNENVNKVDSSYSTSNSSNRFKKCYAYRNKPEYKQCMKKYYRCHQFNNDIENLKKCRIKFGVTVPTKLN